MSKQIDDGDYQVRCDFSGFNCLRSECVVMWNGLLVRRDFAELECHPQDFIPVAKEKPFKGEVRNEQAYPDKSNANAYYGLICFYDLRVSYDFGEHYI